MPSEAAEKLPIYAKGSTPMAAPRGVALVARDWIDEVPVGLGKFLDTWGFAPHFREVIRAASAEGADWIVFSLWSHNASRQGKICRSELFPVGTQHQAVFLEAEREGHYCAEIHSRESQEPIRFLQRFGKSADPVHYKKMLMAELPSRQLGSALLLLCGETNIIKTKRHSGEVCDELCFLTELKRMKTKLIVNPIHNYMFRHEMRRKCQIISENGRIVLSVWNRGDKNGSEALLPWTAFANGKDITHTIKEIRPVPSQPGIRMGIVRTTL